MLDLNHHKIKFHAYTAATPKLKWYIQTSTNNGFGKILKDIILEEIEWS